MADEIKATPVKNKQALGLSKAVQKAHELLSKPFGYNNPPGELLSEFIDLPSLAQTLERIGYGEPLTTGAGGLGGTTRPREEAIYAAMAVAPLAQLTKGMPVGLTFIGPNAKTFDGNRAMKAVAMEKKGADPVDIWRETGTFRGADGIWRQEISDKQAKFLTPEDRALRIAENKLAIDKLKEQIAPTPQKDLFPKALTEAKKEAREEISGLKGENKMRERNPRTQGLNAQYIFEHPELYKAYPELRNVNITTEGGSGSTRAQLSIIPSRGQLPGTMAMDIFDAGLKGNPTSTTLHEMQHAIQTIEGMHPGGSPTMAFADPIAHEMLKQERLKMLKALPYEDFVRQGGYTDMEQAGKDYIKYTKDLEKGIDPAYDRMLQDRIAMDYYKRLGGEAEARAVQERAIESDAENKMAHPFSSYDVLPEKLIIKPPREFKDGGVVISDNPDTMMMELQDRYMAGGGAVRKGLKALFSKVDEVAKELPRTKGTGAEFMKELEKTKGVKPAEIQHRKLNEIKAMPKMTKEQFLGELDKRPPANLSEKVLKQPSESEIEKMAEELAETEAQRYAKRHAESWREEEYLFKEEKERLLKNEIDRLRQDARFELTSGIENKGSAPKYGEYTLPGGENYREILVKYEPYGEGTPLGNAVRALGYKGDLNDLSPRMLEDMGAPKELVSQWKDAIDTFSSSHYKEPNVIAHARVSDRVTPEGERVLHVEEIQSDWHQQGRKKGYANKNAEKEYVDYLNDLQKRVAEDIKQTMIKEGVAEEKAATLGQNMAQRIADDPRKLADFLGESEKQMSLHQARMKAREGVPDAPFKKNWHELMMNRILADAAENGYDRVAISPGVVQAERYDLSKQVSSLMFYTDPGAETGVLRALDLNGDPVIKERIPVSKLDDYVGKDAAKKLLDQTPIQNETTGLPSELRTLNGVDLQVGGEGMKGFYDKMLPDYLNSLGKKYGVQVEAINMPRPPKDSSFAFGYEGGDLYNQGLINWDEFLQRSPHAAKEFSTSLHSFKITPEMRQEFTEKGFPMYSIAAPVGLGATQMEEPKPVQITDNPDAMMMELGDKEFAGGGIIKRLARAPAKSKQEIEAIAERIAPQVTGEFVRKPKETQSVAGKTQKQFAREKDLPVKFTDVKNVPKVEVIDPEQLKGMVVTGVPGDPTVTGKSLVSVGDIKLDSPSPQHGGPLYGLGRDDDIFWASGIDPAGRVQTVAKEAMQAYDAPVAGQYIMMGPDSINYAQHFADANLSAIDLSKMTKKQIEEFNKLIRFGNAESGPRPSFPGIENKEDAYLHFAFDPALRKHFNAVMQMPTVTERFNLPSGQDIRFAVTEEPLRNLETGVTGYSMGRLAPEVPKSALPMSEHPTYSHDIPGQFMGGLKYPTPYELSFPDTLKSVMEHPRQKLSPFGSLKYVGPRQIYDQQMVDELKMYEEAMKKLTGKKEGGEVKKPVLDQAKESLSDAFSSAMNKVTPMRYMGRMAVLDAIRKSPILEASKDPQLNTIRQQNLQDMDSGVSEFKRHNLNAIKRALGLETEPTPEIDWNKSIEFENLDAPKKIDGFQTGGLIKVKNKRKAKA